MQQTEPFKGLNNRNRDRSDEDNDPMYGSVETKETDPSSNVDTTDVSEAVHDGGWGWFVLLGCFLVHIVSGGFGKTNGVLYLQMKNYYGESAVITTWVVTLENSFRLLLGPIASAMCNRFTVRTVVTIGATLCVVGVFVSAFSPSIIFFAFNYGLLVGIGRAFAYCPSIIILGKYFSKRRSLVVGLATSGSGFSGLLFPPMFDKLFRTYGFFGSFLIKSAIFSHFYIAACLYRSPDQHQNLGENTRLLNLDAQSPAKNGPRSDEKGHRSNVSSTLGSGHQLTHKKLQTPDTQQKKSEPKKRLLDFSLLTNFTFLCLCFEQLLMHISNNVTVTYLPALVVQRGFDITDSAYVVSVACVCDGLARIVTSVLDLERIRAYRLMLNNVSVLVYAIGCLLLTVSASSLWDFYITSGLLGAASGFGFAQISVNVVDILGVEHLTDSFGLMLGFQGAGVLLVPVLGGVLVDTMGTYDHVFIFSALSAFIAAVVMSLGNLWMYRRRQKGYSHVT